MGWDKDRLRYIYTKGALKGIAACYAEIYLIGFHRTTNPYSIAEYKADFDVALSYIGRGDWRGLEDTNLKAYRYFGKAQQVVISDILGITDPDGSRDHKLQPYGFYQIPQLRGKAYSWMVKFLNGIHTDGHIPKAKGS